MWSWFVDAMRDHPELAIFLTLAIGFFVGKLSFKSLTLGAVTGTLLAGVLIGQLDLGIPDLVKTVAFIGFLFALGYRVGPQFFAALRKGGGPQIAVAVIGSLVGLAVAYALAKLLGYGPGWGAGLLAGGLTQSSVIGVATDAINASSAIPDDQKQTLVNQIPVGYAVCYLVGTAAAAYFLSQLAPRLLGSRALAADAHELERQYGVAEERPDPGLPAAGPAHVPGRPRLRAGRYRGRRRGGAGGHPGPADLPAPVPPRRRGPVHRAGHRAAGR